MGHDLGKEEQRALNEPITSSLFFATLLQFLSHAL